LRNLASRYPAPRAFVFLVDGRDQIGDIVLAPTEPDPSVGRQSRIMFTLVFLVALVVAGFVVGLVWWPRKVSS
jgi:hypothetical protein